MIAIQAGIAPDRTAAADIRFAAQALATVPYGALQPARLSREAFALRIDSPNAIVPAAPDATVAPTGAETSAAATAKEADPDLPVDLAGARQAMLLYRQGDLPAGDDFAKPTSGPLRTLLDWAAVRLQSRDAGLPRLEQFAAAHPGWAAAPWVQRRIEEQRSAGRDPATVLALFAKQAPETLSGKLALARARLATGDLEGGARVVRAVWRDDDLTPAEEGLVLRSFSAQLRREDHKYRADRLLYRENVPAALRAAALAGPDVLQLARARADVIALAPSDAAIASVAKPLQNDPGLLFSRIQKARRANKLADAVALLRSAPIDPAALIDGDQWWIERRLVARKLLDAGDLKTAFAICAAHAPASNALEIEAEFHAGWIALRFLKDPALAAPHFAIAAKLALTPISIARAAYWQARAAEAAGDVAHAATFYGAAADLPTTFYGQLAAAQIGRTAITLRQPTGPATGATRRESIRVVALLYGLGERELAQSLAIMVAKTEPDEAQVAALAAVVSANQDARTMLAVGKAATQRGMALDDAAFPTFGVPGYQPLVNSADRSTVYAIARQESEFDPRSVSSAGAKGLMQLIDSTARQTAVKAGVGFDETRLLTDASFNAQIGAAHLGKLLADEGGSYILTFAAYNAGGRKVQEWIDAYGDPRKPGVDPIDWIERIPFTETRNYVQRVFENLQIYRSRFGMPLALLAEPQPAGKGT